MKWTANYILKRKRKLVALQLCIVTIFVCGSSSRCRGFVCSMWLWYFLIVLPTFLTNNVGTDEMPPYAAWFSLDPFGYCHRYRFWFSDKKEMFLRNYGNIFISVLILLKKKKKERSKTSTKNPDIKSFLRFFKNVTSCACSHILIWTSVTFLSSIFWLLCLYVGVHVSKHVCIHGCICLSVCMYYGLVFTCEHAPMHMYECRREFACVCLFVLLLYVPSQQLWSLWDGQITYVITLISWESLNKQLTSTSCTYFRL